MYCNLIMVLKSRLLVICLSTICLKKIILPNIEGKTLVWTGNNIYLNNIYTLLQGHYTTQAVLFDPQSDDDRSAALQTARLTGWIAYPIDRKFFTLCELTMKCVFKNDKYSQHFILCCMIFKLSPRKQVHRFCVC